MSMDERMKELEYLEQFREVVGRQQFEALVSSVVVNLMLSAQSVLNTTVVQTAIHREMVERR